MKIPEDKKADVRGNLHDKADYYGWKTADNPGVPMSISKHKLNIDHAYQRDHVRKERVARLASNWSWGACGTLRVARRPDGTYWVFDGQHRKLAADKRSDIDLLPCMVFDSRGPLEESKWYLDANADRGGLSMVDRYKAMLAHNHTHAVQVKDMVAANGFEIGSGGGTKTVRCLGVLVATMKADPMSARVAWEATVLLSKDDHVHDRIYKGFFAVERHLKRLGLGSLLGIRAFRDRINDLSVKAVQTSINETIAYHSKTGEKAFGEGILRLLNKGRIKKNRIPSLMGPETEGAGDELDC